MNVQLKLVDTLDDIQACFPVMSQLRPRFTQSDFVTQVLQQQSQGYFLLAAFLDGNVVGCAGFVIGTKLAWGKHLYVDDLVADDAIRSSGIGLAMVNWLKEHARKSGCEQLHLDSGVQRFAAHKFYLRENFIINSHHFSIEL